MKTMQHPEKNLLPNTAMLVVLLPLVVLPPVVWFRFVAQRLDQLAATAPWDYLVRLGLLPVGCMAAAVVMLRTRRAAPALTVYSVALLIQFIFGMAFLENGYTPEWHDTAEFGRCLPVRGISVECNGVDLGKTPFSMTEEAFDEKVKPWTGPPPRQPVIRWKNPNPSSNYVWAGFYHVPHDPFPRDVLISSRNADVMNGNLETFSYWWHFEKDGCVGVCEAFDSGGGGSNYERTIHVDPPITFPSLDPHVELLAADLRRHDGVPTEAWLAHFRKYQDLLFVMFHAKYAKDPMLLSGLEAVVRMDFAFPDEPSEADYARIVDDILARVESQGAFAVPSPESFALDLIGAEASEVLACKYLGLVGRSLPNMSGMGRSTGSFSAKSGPGVIVRRMALEHALQRHPAPSLFERLVYEAANKRFRPRLLRLVAGYDRPEAVRIIKEYLRPLAYGHPYDRWYAQEVLELAASTLNLALEKDFRQALLQLRDEKRCYAGGKRFVASRIDAPGVDQAELARWVFHWAPMSDEDKAACLARIQAPWGGNYLNILTSRNPLLGGPIIEYLAGEPNPHCAQFLVAACRDFVHKGLYEGYTDRLYTTMAKIDTPEIRDFVTEVWNEWPDGKQLILERLGHSSRCGSKQEWMLPLLAGLEQDEDMVAAVALLTRINTEEARNLVARWEEEGSPELKAGIVEVKADLEENRRLLEAEEAAKRKEQERLAKALLAGEIEPDDLPQPKRIRSLPPMKAYVWNGEDYVEEDAGEES